MSFITAADGTELYYNDWGRGQPVVFNHAYTLDADAFEDHMFFLASRGYRCIAHDRRGHGRSGQPWQGNDIDTYAEDLALLLDTLDLQDTVLVGHSTGGAIVARYIGRHGTTRVAKAVLIGAVTPLTVKTRENPDGVPIEVFDGFRQAVIADRAAFLKGMVRLYYGADRPEANISEGALESSWLQTMLAGYPAAYFQITAFSETDTSEDLKTFNVPTLIIHGDDDQIAPVGNAYRAKTLIPNAILKIYPGAPHAIIATNKDRINEDLLAFIGSSVTSVPIAATAKILAGATA